MILSSQESTEVQISKLKLKLKSEMYFSYCINGSKDFIYMRFLTAQLNRTLMEKNHNDEGYPKMHKISGNLNFQS